MSRWRLVITAGSLTLSGCYLGVEQGRSALGSAGLDATSDGGDSAQDSMGDTGSGTSSASDPDSDNGVDTSGPGSGTGAGPSSDSDTGPDTGPDTDSGTGPDDTGPPPNDDVPDIPYCAGVADWDPSWTALENEILALTNVARASGTDCGSAGAFGPAEALSMSPQLRCSARVHSLDMAERNFFDHTNPDGVSAFARMAMAGYNYSSAGENIAAGNATAAATMQQWLGSPGHCANIMSQNFTELGVGYAPGGQWGFLWTQNLARP